MVSSSRINSSSPAPLLLLDVDGVISLFGFGETYPPAGSGTIVDGIPHWISASVGPLVARLCAVFECVWCTGWEERAGEHLPSLLGIPGGWPHLSFGPPGNRTRHWKLDAIDAFTGPERPVAWVDDDHDETCEQWASSRIGPTLLVATDPAVGLTETQADQLIAWARGQTAPHAPS